MIPLRVQVESRFAFPVLDKLHAEYLGGKRTFLKSVLMCTQTMRR